MVVEWDNKTSNPIDDIEALRKQIRSTSKIKPASIYFEGKNYTFNQFVELMESRKANNE
jgi:hypothetical protein